MIRSLCLLLALTLPLTAQNFRYHRAVLHNGRGPQHLAVDLLLLGHSARGLADLRLFDATGREVPYVLVPPRSGEAPWKSARLLPLPETKENSGFEMDLGGPLLTSKLRIEGLRSPFLKRFRLEGSGDRQRWTELVKEGSLFDLPGEGLRLLEADFPAGEYRYLRLVWDDRSSARMALPRSAAVQPQGATLAPSLANLSFEPRPSEPGVSRFTIHLPGPRLPLRSLVLEVGGSGPLLRDARISESRLQSRDLVPVSLGEGRLRRAVRSEVSASDLRIPIEMPEGSDLDLRVEDGDNPPLELKTVKAEMEPQPWIYFEASGPENLTARFGDPKLSAPRYDLEANRGYLLSSKPAQARWGDLESEAVPDAPAPFDLDPGPGALLDSTPFRFHRVVPDSLPGLVALVLDPHVLAHSQTLKDLRLIDKKGRQIPYLLEQRDEPLSLDLTLVPGHSRGHSTFYTLTLSQAGFPASRLVLETSARVFRRRVLLHEEGPGGESPVILESDWMHEDPGLVPPAQVLTLPSLQGRTLVLEIDEGDNQPLPLKSARLYLPTWRLRFFHPGEGLQLCYGCELGAPDYDLALLADRLRNAAVREIVLPEEGSRSRGDHASLFAKVFWGVLAAAVLALLFLLARLLKQPGGKP